MIEDQTAIRVPPDCRKMIRVGTLVTTSHNGGKDSQVMTILLPRVVPPRDQLVTVHAPLEDVEWPGTVEHIRATLPNGGPDPRARHLRQDASGPHRGTRPTSLSISQVLYFGP